MTGRPGIPPDCRKPGPRNEWASSAARVRHSEVARRTNLPAPATTAAILRTVEGSVVAFRLISGTGLSHPPATRNH